MKHLLLILISFLILSSPVIGQETGVLYQYETSTGIKWKTFGDGKVQPKYKGEIKNGEMDGLGVLIYPYDGKSVVGEWKNGKEWNTVHKEKDGTLLGKYENGVWELMWGVLYSKQKIVRAFGNEWFTTNSGGYLDDGDESISAKYEGEIKKLKPHGNGTYVTMLGYRKVGEWKNGKIWNGIFYGRNEVIFHLYENGVSKGCKKCTYTMKENIDE